MNKTILIIGALVIVALGGFFILSGGEDESATVTPTPTPASVPTETPEGTATTPPSSMGVVKEFSVTGTPFRFSLAEMKVNKGDTVRIVFKNEAGFHDWKIDEFNAATKQLKAGEQETIEFVANKTGSFEYYCSVGTHRQMGMKGKLIVE